MSNREEDGPIRTLNINVGILGHVDSGKTSLVKSLSTALSTASLDKNPQSQQRGITLDLGFSAFNLPLPERLTEYNKEYDNIQFTLVDCPGHSSLIRTILGGAQIIDMIILVIDVNKGIQAQTAECIVIGELTTDQLIIVLNKIDKIPEEERETKINKMTKRIRKSLIGSKFADAIIVPISAYIGGEKVAAITTEKPTTGKGKTMIVPNPTMGIDDLIEVLKNNVRIPKRNVNSPFYFSIDHCFAIKGHGTVLTGTIISGMVDTNTTIEIPHLQIERKVKSMQMFHKPVKVAKQGDRLGICVSNLDPKNIERSIAVTPGSVHLISNALCLVKKIRYFKFPCRSGTKFHVSIGHTTVLANVIFFGASDLNQEKQTTSLSSNDSINNLDSTFSALSLQSPYYARTFPIVEYDFNREYELQDELQNPETMAFGEEPVQWALLQFQHPVYCPLGSLVIGSRLDVDSKEHAGEVNHCRLAFWGPIKHSIPTPDQLEDINVFQWKQKDCEINKLIDVRKGLCFEAVGWKLARGALSFQHFVGLRVMAPDGEIGIIMNTHGTEGMFRIKFPKGAKVGEGTKLVFKFKQFYFDKTKHMEQNNNIVIEETELEALGPNEIQNEFNARKINPKKQKKKENKETNQINSEDQAKLEQIDPSNGSQGSNGVESLNQITSPLESTKESLIISPPPPPSVSEKPQTSESLFDNIDPTSVEEYNRVGKLESIKSEESNGKTTCSIIVSGAFKMEENIRLYSGSKVITENGEIGELVGPFGKLGKCKVAFPLLIKSSIGSSVHFLSKTLEDTS